MKIDQKELDRRAAEADRARLILRRATLELMSVTEQLLEQHKSRKHDNRPSRSDDSSDRGQPRA
jgi:hypothetical protein